MQGIDRLVVLFLGLILNSSLLLAAKPEENCADPAIAALVLKAKQEISERIYLTLATSDFAGHPWNSPVYTAYDARYGFYWISEKSSRHSQNLSFNPESAVVIYNSSAPLFSGFGVYMQGSAKELNRIAQISKGLELISARAGLPLPSAEHFQGSNRLRVYKFIPRKFWVNTQVQVGAELVDRRLQITSCMEVG
jgi:hypothetical protein